MSELITAITTGITAFSATNIDDIVILTLFFSQINQSLRRRHIFAGQYLGFTALIIASLPGFFGGLIIPQSWIRLLGLMPIIIGFNSLFKPEDDAGEEVEADTEPSYPSAIASLFSPQICNIAAVTFANGGDNISVYMPLFANCELENLLVIIGVFFAMVGVWCYIAAKLTNIPAIANFLTEYGKSFVPCVLIGLGVFIVTENSTLTLTAVVVSYLFSVIFNWNSQPVDKAEKSLIS